MPASVKNDSNSEIIRYGISSDNNSKASQY